MKLFVVETPRATRGDCLPGGINGARPCPYTHCRYHIEPDRRTRRGSGRHTSQVPDRTESCALDVADRHEHTLDYVAGLLGVTRERVRQIEVQAVRKLRRTLGEHLGDAADDLLRVIFTRH